MVMHMRSVWYVSDLDCESNDFLGNVDPHGRNVLSRYSYVVCDAVRA
jgi:hypothetical protein